MTRNLLAGMMVFVTTLLVPAQVPVEAVKQPLVIAAEDGAGPWGQADGTGCGNDLVLAAYAAVQVPVRLDVMPYARAKNGALSGSYVGCFGMAWTPELKGKILFADKPLYSVTAMLMQASERPLKAASEKELQLGTKVGVVFEYEYPPAFYDLVKQGKLVPMSSYSEATSLKNLDLNRIDAALVVVDDLKSADYLIAQSGMAGRVSPAFSIGGQSTYLGFSTAHPQSEYAWMKFNEGFAIIQKDGIYKRIVDTWKAKVF